MKISKQLLVSLLILVAVASLYRIMPRQYGFAPQIAMAIFGGAIIKEKKFSFLLPILSMFISDVLYEILFVNGMAAMSGFYSGQLLNYALFAGLTIFGFSIKGFDLKKIGLASVAAPTAYFLASNFFVWLSSSPLAGFARPKTFDGLMMCYADGLPFYPWSLVSTLVFSALFFGCYYFMFQKQVSVVKTR